MATVKPALNGKAVETASTMKRGGIKGGLRFERYFTDGRTSPFDEVEWEKRTALIGNEKGVTIFKRKTWKCRRTGRRRRQTSLPANTSTERWEHRTGKRRCGT